ncbi:MAG: prepilin-type N-terminal cleavage/methylation domain-containing protein [Bacilli bacterium]|nr:prepilin-type N-terminal cleavage/methylation domain-containing protein [Bacilli bacterium]
MKLNKKGVSIIELIISVTLISIIMLFMYRLLSDITFEKDGDTFAFLNQERRVTILKNVEKTIGNNNTLTSIAPSGATINFKSGSTNTYQLTVSSDKKTLTFKQGSTVLDSWPILGGTLVNPTCTSKALNSGTIYNCIIKIYTENTNNKDYTTTFNSKTVTINNNNIIDDLVFTFVIWK